MTITCPGARACTCRLRNRPALSVRVNTPTRHRLTIETTYDLNDDKSRAAPSVTKTVLVLGIWPLTAARSPALTEISSRGSALRARSARFMSFLSWFSDAFLALCAFGTAPRAPNAPRLTCRLRNRQGVAGGQEPGKSVEPRSRKRLASVP